MVDVTKIVAKGFIEMTKQKIEGDREQKIRELFKETFGFQPEKVEWVFDQEQGTILQAETKIKLDETHTIEGKKVVKVEFYLKENPEVNADLNWEYSRSSRGPWSVYKWKKRLNGYIAWVEILAD